MALSPEVVDVPISTLSQTPPEHAGPSGRLVAMQNAEVVHYVPPTAGGAGGATPQSVSVQQRSGFVSLSGETRQSSDGAGPVGDLVVPELLATLGDQLLSIGNSVPNVYNGADWTRYRDGVNVDVRVLTGKLSESILHTSNRTIQACDSAILDDVTCSVWTETNEGLTISYVGFKSTDGAWVVTPRVLYASASGSSVALAKVVSDGTRFWVFYDDATTNLQIQIYDTHGALLAATTKVRRWTTSPGFWDIVVSPSNTVILAQPGTYDPGNDVHVDLTTFGVGAGPSITQSSNIDMSINCQGPVAWLTNKAGFSDFSYLATVAPGPTDFLAIMAYEIDEDTRTQTHEYAVTTVADTNTLDAMTGYIRAGSGIGVVVAVSFLSEYLPPAGPPNDPGLRSVRVYDCERDGTQVFVKQANGVLLQSRAFQVATSPPEASDFYAVTYYESGGGLLPSETAVTIPIDNDDNMIGEVDQKVPVTSGDYISGAPHFVPISFDNAASVSATQSASSITHNAGDSATASTQTWVFLNANFHSWALYSSLNISGSSITTNNQSYLILQVVNSTTIVTEGVGSDGDQMQDDNLSGVTASLTSNIRILNQQGPPPFNPVADLVPPDMLSLFLGGDVTLANLIHPVDDGAYPLFRIVTYATGFSPPLAPIWQNIILTGTLSVVGGPGEGGGQSTAATTMAIAPVFPYAWAFATGAFGDSYVGNTLIVTGAEPSNNGEFLITTALLSALFTEGADSTMLLPQRFTTAPLPEITVRLALPNTALTFTFNDFFFDPTYVGAFLTIVDAAHAVNNGVYVIEQVVSSHIIQVRSATGATGQVNEDFFGGDVVATVNRATNTSPAYQPCWLLTPLSVPQQTAGRFEYGIAYADWRLDGATEGEGGLGASFARNQFPFALSSVEQPHLTDNVVVLPYRAQSFTAGQVVRSGPNVVGVASVQESTVGLKQFALSGSTFGQAVTVSGEMLLPGPMGAAFTASGFHEDGVNFGFEQPFLVSTDADSDVLGLSKNTAYQIVVVAEVMDENGDRTFSLPSPPLNFNTNGDENTATYGGRMVSPTNRTLVGIAIYRTAVQGGVPTVQHYKVTNDLDVNGVGFTFTTVNGGSSADTWEYVDTQPDVSILSAEIMYTDKGLTPRYPVPACSQGVGSWCNRTWVVGYDGAVWMSGEKTEGDAVWFTPLFRYVLPTDDKPVAVAGLDEYMLVFCSRSIWYIPKADFIAANLQSGSLPTPVQLPFQNGCTGWAVTIRSGVAYASSAGGVWLITRQLTNGWLSQDVQSDLTDDVTSILVDEKQRMHVFSGSTSVFMFDQVSQCWARWILPGAAALACAWQGRATYQDLATPSHVAVHTPGVFADTIGTTTTAVAPDVTLAGINMAGVRSYKRAWAIQIVGQYRGPHRLNVVVSYPDEDQDPTTYEPFTPAADEAYVYEVNPDPEEASTFGVRVYADFVGIEEPGNSFTLEILSFEVGLERGINRLTASKRIPSL